MKGKHYWQCPNAQCDAEWYSNNPKDYYCPKCGVGPCAESWHPDDFDDYIKKIYSNKDEEEEIVREGYNWDLIDWQLLKEQKHLLVEIIRNKNPTEFKLTEQHTDAIEGIINFLDTIQDYAVDDLGIPEDEVFKFEEKEKG